MLSDGQNQHGLVFPVLGACLCLLIILFQNCSDVKLLPVNNVFFDPPVEINLSKQIHQVSADGGFACVIVGENHTAKCWGDNSAGQLGNNATVNSNIPVDVIL